MQRLFREAEQRLRQIRVGHDIGGDQLDLRFEN
jgi:hypothetical protein